MFYFNDFLIYILYRSKVFKVFSLIYNRKLKIKWKPLNTKCMLLKQQLRKDMKCYYNKEFIESFSQKIPLKTFYETSPLDE